MRIAPRFRKGRFDGRRVTAMPVEEIETLKSVSREGLNPVAQCRLESGGPQRNRPWKGQVMLGHANVEGRRYEKLATASVGFVGDDFGAQPVSPQQARRTVMLGGSNGNDDGAATLQPGVDRRSSGQRK
jgi:hypothetical protein